jgi:phosphatidylserine/phosphatidylglycerophosphate/cardiolipin synthase-like enzyme
MTGSFNFSKKAELSNAENLLTIRDQAVAARYIENWQTLQRPSTGCGGRGMLREQALQQALRQAPDMVL